MTSIKIEIDAVCRGCLSFDRDVVPLKNNASLFFLLLADQFIPADSCYFNVFLCWECIALLRRVATFQKQLQKSKDIFLYKWLQKEASANDCLTRLKTYHKDNYDIIIEYQDFHHQFEPNIEIQEINSDTNNCIKEESIDNHFGNYNDNDLNKTDFNNQDDEPRVKRTKKRSVTATPVVYDDAERDRYIHEVEMTIKELEASEMDKRDNIYFLSYRANILVKKMLSTKQRDVKNCNKTESTCSHCATKVPDKMTMTQHWEGHTVTLYKCVFCIHRGHDRDDVMTHLRQKHNNIYTCKCGVEFRSLRYYYNHYKNLHSKYECDYCKKSYKSRNTIEKHITHSHLPSICKICHRRYKSYKILMNHYCIYHPELRPVKYELPYCVECDIRFHNELLYKRHLRTSVAHRPKDGVQIPCPDCGKIFSRKSYMTNHYNLVHVRQSKHYCEICDKYFITGYSIRTHMKFVHEKREKPKDKICEICGRGFFTNRVLINHMRTHTGERPYKCSFCPAAFAQRSAMKTHEKTQHKSYINS